MQKEGCVQFVAITREKKERERERERERDPCFFDRVLCRLVLFFVVKKERHDDERTH